MLRYLPIVACALALAAPAAEAQKIYAWTDSHGTMVLSDRPPETRTNDASRRPVPAAYAAPRRAPAKPVSLATITPAAYRATRPIETKFYNIYDRFIDRYATTYGVSVDLVRAVIQVESAFNPFARSSEGAVGLMQLMPDTAIEMGVRNRLDPEDNIRGGVAYLRQLLNRYGNDVPLALAAYNAGPAAVDRHGAVPPYRETQQYVANVTRRSGDAPAVSRPQPPAGASRVVYKTVQVQDGHPVTRYSNSKPSAGPYEIIPFR
jgi:soluble lytic murein transglycosylase-like protein